MASASAFTSAAPEGDAAARLLAQAAAMPLAGLAYLITHPRLWPTFICVAVVALVVCIGALVGLGFALAPIANGLAAVGCPLWLGWIIAVIIMLLGTAVAGLLCVSIAFGCVQQLVGHRVLVNEGVVDRLKKAGYSEPTCLGDCAANIVWLLVRLVVLVVMLPVNIIPVLGQIIYFQVNGFLYAWQLHGEYLALRGMPTVFSQRRYVVDRYKAYAAFGAVALALELFVPGINFVFIFSNTVGASLFAKVLLEADAPPPYDGADAAIAGSRSALTV